MIRVGVYTKGDLTHEYLLKVNEHFKTLLGKDIENGFILENRTYPSISNRLGSPNEVKTMMIERASRLVHTGADKLVIPHNGLNSLAPYIEDAVGVPVIKPADGLAEGAGDLCLSKVGLVATKEIMNSAVIKSVLEASGIEVILPSQDEQELLDQIIYTGLAGKEEDLYQKMSDQVINIIERLKAQGANGCVIGCTDLSKIVYQNMIDFPLLDSIDVHTRDIAGHMADSITEKEAKILGIDSRAIIERKENPYKIFY